VSQIRLQPVVVSNVTTYGTVIDVPNAQLKLKPGMTANVKVEIAKRTDVLRVPAAALRFRPSTDIFAALNQPVPPEALAGTGTGRGGRSGFGRGGATGATPPAAASGGDDSSGCGTVAIDDGDGPPVRRKRDGGTTRRTRRRFRWLRAGG
jgi:multidrug efflux pump subunit AcrA (membrane-fusion protein)